MTLELLRWYQAMGVDEAIADEPLDWSQYAPPALPVVESASVQPSPGRDAPTAQQTPARNVPRQSPSAPAAIARATPTAAPDASVMAARGLAREAPDLEALHTVLTTFDGCPLKKTAKNLCFARGAPNARLMLIGEAPGRDEDLQGEPFVGRAGRLLDRMLAAIGFGGGEAYITNVVYWRPPGNRTPTPQEVLACQPFLERQIELVAPDVLVLLGGAAAKQVLATDTGIMKLRGKWKSYNAGGRTIRTMATLHPAYLLRSPAAKRQAWRDLLMVKAALAEVEAETGSGSGDG
ncbi:MAG: uracil-DNA glycosylase family protein [Alphaproteobacteria bacterium]